MKSLGESAGARAGQPQVALLLRILDEGFDRRAWHGPNLRGTLRGLDSRRASWRPAPGRHNIWELAVHAAYWKYAVRRRLTGDKRGSFALPGSNWFARRGDAGAAAWRADLALLTAEHRKLREVVARLRDDDLPCASAGSRQSNATLIHGVAAHDLYHAGQIQLLKRLGPGPM
ncbi:MAG TPA: DinB family protein [Vicinamibacteria bacterium]|nr:DinB family protein [Vicinamibacteria bacterium]